MRVIAGIAKRIPLKTIPGFHTRPTTDRIKETLFNIIQYGLADAVFLDLFSGSGAIGIEALSRGAGQAVFVEGHAESAACIRDNLKATKLEGRAMVMGCDVLDALRRLEGKVPHFDFVFMDPPYDQGWEQKVLGYLAGASYVNGDTEIIIEASRDTAFPYLEALGFAQYKQKQYKTNQHVFVSLDLCT